MLSLHLGWVNVIPASGPGGITMKGMALAFTLFLFSSSSMAADCFDMAGRDYRIDPDLLRAISWQESKWVVGAIGKKSGNRLRCRTDANRFAAPYATVAVRN